MEWIQNKNIFRHIIVKTVKTRQISLSQLKKKKKTLLSKNDNKTYNCLFNRNKRQTHTSLKGWKNLSLKLEFYVEKKYLLKWQQNQNTFRKFVISRIQRNTPSRRKIIPIRSMKMQGVIITQKKKNYMGKSK